MISLQNTLSLKLFFPSMDLIPHMVVEPTHNLPHVRIVPRRRRCQRGLLPGKYNSYLDAMHAFLVFRILFMSTGQTFGDCTSPANWEPVGRNRQQYAQFLWHQVSTLVNGMQYLPKLQFAPTPSPTVVTTFVQATPDSLNTGVLNKQAQRVSPQFNHHVDDCFYADIQELFPLAAASSILAFYLLLGHPAANHRDPVSWEKFVAKVSHRWKAKGFIINTHTMEVSIPDYKRDQVVGYLPLGSHGSLTPSWKQPNCSAY